MLQGIRCFIQLAWSQKPQKNTVWTFLQKHSTESVLIGGFSLSIHISMGITSVLKQDMKDNKRELKNDIKKLEGDITAICTWIDNALSRRVDEEEKVLLHRARTIWNLQIFVIKEKVVRVWWGVISALKKTRINKI